MPFKIAIVDDRSQVRIALIEEIGQSGEAKIVFTAKNGKDYLEQMRKLDKTSHPQAVLMDVDMPVMNGIEAVKAGKQLYPNVEYIMFTIFDDDDKLFEALKAGASGYLLKHESGRVILNAIEELINKKGAPMSSSIARKTLNLLLHEKNEKKAQKLPESNLTERETDILKGLVSGMDYKQLAAEFLVSPNTVRNHIANIYTKLHITNKGQAMAMAVKNKWI